MLEYSGVIPSEQLQLRLGPSIHTPGKRINAFEVVHQEKEFILDYPRYNDARLILVPHMHYDKYNNFRTINVPRECETSMHDENEVLD
eukprot:3006753-Prorocentrum_lima.AAC.1